MAMRLFIFLVLVGGVVLLVLQNGQFQSLMLFGYALPALPVAVWLAGAIAAGILTSTLLQLLNYRPKFTARVDTSLPPRGAPERREPIPEPPPERSRDSVRPPQPPPREPESDWEPSPRPRNDSWEEPRGRSQPNFRKEVRPQAPVTPPNPPRERPSSPPTDNTVYDANYRVINPPIVEEPARSTNVNEEDWGFDDEEFESEYRQQSRDREP